MTNLQYGTLRYLVGHSVSMDDIRMYNLTTLGSLIQHGWVERRGNQITATQEGVEAFELYHRGGPNYRQHEADLSERVRLMLHIRTLNVIKAAS